MPFSSSSNLFEHVLHEYDNSFQVYGKTHSHLFDKPEHWKFIVSKHGLSGNEHVAPFRPSFLKCKLFLLVLP
jgi:hypothetical protein